MIAPPLKAAYYPAARNAADITTALVSQTEGSMSLPYMGRIQIDGVAHTEWSPFTAINPSAALNLDTITASAGEAVQTGLVTSAVLTADRINLRVDITKLTVGTNAKLAFWFAPDESWPLIDGLWQPRKGAVEILVPMEWSTG